MKMELMNGDSWEGSNDTPCIILIFSLLYTIICQYLQTLKVSNLFSKNICIDTKFQIPSRYQLFIYSTLGVLTRNIFSFIFSSEENYILCLLRLHNFLQNNRIFLKNIFIPHLSITSFLNIYFFNEVLNSIGNNFSWKKGPIFSIFVDIQGDFISLGP